MGERIDSGRRGLVGRAGIRMVFGQLAMMASTSASAVRVKQIEPDVRHVCAKSGPAMGPYAMLPGKAPDELVPAALDVDKFG